MEFNLSVSTICFWLKSKINVDNHFVSISVPNTLLGIIPLGKNEEKIPTKSITNVKSSFSVRIIPIIIGLFLIFAGFGGIRPDASSIMGALLLFAIGALLIINGLTIAFLIERAGPVTAFKVPFYNKKTADALCTAIHQAMASEIDKNDLNVFFDKKSQ